ncbi:hypothetical protein SAMN05444274_10350 [Mariniphaga anaerophila]|uniref:Uncharacterized protein n=1 Tax=Mariniphaga anaerophila TaxID=1484053 RepID=A0A1M4XLZ1_9BACT|nr:hypothetical protein SAMN05444274_10350 [Mariniphaga anaerophila]
MLVYCASIWFSPYFKDAGNRLKKPQPEILDTQDD